MVKNLPAKAGDERDGGLILRWGKIPWSRKWQPTPKLLSGKSHGQRSLAGYIPWGLKELNTTEQLSMCACLHVKIGKDLGNVGIRSTRV